MKKLRPLLSVMGFLLLLLYISSCEKIIPQAPRDEDILDGPVDGLTSDQKKQFLKGDIAFNDEV